MSIERQESREKGGELPPMTDTKNEIIISDDQGEFAFKKPERFAAINRMILRDLNKVDRAPMFYKYTRDQIAGYLKNPYKFQKNLRDAVIYMYGASSHFRRLIQYFVGLSDLSYVIGPYKTDTTAAKPQTTRRNFRRVTNLMASMDVKNQFEKILTVCFREDVFFGTIWETTDSTIIQQLPTDYCAISVIEDNVLNVTFDFSYFDSHLDYLPLYPEEFRIKYERYQKDKIGLRWQELDAPNSFCIKANKDILSYAIPPFVGILRELFDLEDFKSLRMAREEIENYALLVMNLGIDDDGNYVMDYGKAKGFFQNLSSVLPDEIGAVLSPLPIDKIGFERTHPESVSSVSDAEENLFTSAGVSSLLFNNSKASANALLLSIKADQCITYSVVKSIECMVNRFIHRHGYGKYFKVTFLDCSPYNRKEYGDAMLKAATYGLPTLSYYAASQGLSQDDLDGMNYLEDTVLDLKERLVPLRSSATQSSSDVDSTGEAGRPQSDIGDLSDEGERTRERGEE